MFCGLVVASSHDGLSGSGSIPTVSEVASGA